ncbi:serine hydrolase domain-containing protein [Tundrisphaera lichenicola]|uniref:serine hydrolase domain-containing protein n=1 Tax=Tundrisphaera lichenicola TaxID=2029860 RepID=UPI003EBFDC21
MVSLLDSSRTRGKGVPGMIGAVVRGNGSVIMGASGVRKVGSDDPIRVDHQVHIGSCTKAMTATMIGTLVEEGKLAWNSTIQEVFPGRSGGFHPDFRSVTLRQLLAHRAGLPPNVAWRTVGLGLSDTDKRRVVLSMVLKDAPKSSGGHRFEYSNVGYVLAGLMAEEVTGITWDALMQTRIFEPLGMTSTGFGPPGHSEVDDQPWGHIEVGGIFQPIRLDNPSVMGPAGTVHCSVSNWAKFARLHLGSVPEGNRPPKQETLKALHAPAKDEDYVCGWLIRERAWAGGSALSHSGSNTTWYSTIWVAPVRQIAFLVATNSGGNRASRACDEAISRMIRLVGMDGS